MVSSCCWLLAIGSNACGGIVAFNPPVILDDGLTAGIYTLTVSVAQSDLPSFDAVDIVFGSDGPELVSWAWNPAITRFFDAVRPNTFNSEYQDSLQIGYFGLPPNNAPLILGQLTIDLTGLASGEYWVGVDFERDEGGSSLASGLQLDYLSGSALIYARIPEPAGFALLLVGAAALATPRRRLS